MSVYYIDPLIGESGNDGMSETTPLDTHENLRLCAGDVVLFRRGTSYRGGIFHAGLDGAPVTFGAYGNGEPPKFFGSINRSEPYLWQACERKNVWRLAVLLKYEPCNVIFDFGNVCGTFSETEDGLSAQGEWYARKFENGTEFYLYSSENPGKYYGDIEIALGKAAVFSAGKNAVFEGLCISCAGVHGFAAQNPENIKITDCRFEFIGGRAVGENGGERLGNGIDISGGGNISVCDCSFYNIFGSCVALRGTDGAPRGENIVCTGNNMENYGTAAFELCADTGENVIFELNVCSGAGRGFAPRARTDREGRHVIVRRETRGEGERVEIRRNIFRGLPADEAIYICFDGEGAKPRINIENNEFC